MKLGVRGVSAKTVAVGGAGRLRDKIGRLGADTQRRQSGQPAGQTHTGQGGSVPSL